MLTYGEKVKFCRIKSGITQTDLADRIGLDRPLLSHFENNHIDLKYDRLQLLATALGISSLDASIETLLTEVDAKNKMAVAA